MFDDKLIEQIEQYYNLMAVAGMDTVEYNPNLAQMIGQLIADTNGAVTRHGLDIVESFAQHYMLEKGLKNLEMKENK